jgi:hypothetical protein
LNNSGTDDQNISGSGLSGTTLTIGIENGSNETVDLSSLTDHDWYEVGGTSAPNDINDNIFTQGNVAIGKTTITGSRALDVEGDVELNDRLYMNGREALRAITTENWLRLNNANDFTSGTFIQNHLRVDDSMTVNESGGNRNMRVEGQNEVNLLVTDASADAVGIGTATPDALLDVEGGTVRFSDYGNNAVTGTATSLVGVEADGDLVEVNSLKASKIFYPPSIAVDASTNGTGFTIDLHAQYTAQYGTPTVGSAGAPAAVPTYGATELYYYVTYADPSVFDTGTMSIDANGILTYDIIGQPTDYNTLINVVFVVK